MKDIDVPELEDIELRFALAKETARYVQADMREAYVQIIENYKIHYEKVIAQKRADEEKARQEKQKSNSILIE